MEEDTRGLGWPARAFWRWLAYSALWTATLTVGLMSAHHVALKVAASLLGVLLAASLPMLFVTLFEETYSQRKRKDMILMCVPLLGVVVVGLGTLAVLLASSFVIAEISSQTFSTASELCTHFAGLRRDELPRTVCLHNAFVKTDWESGKLRCEEVVGHVECVPAFTAAPIFDSKAEADAGKADEIKAWAVSHGRHVDASYRRDGTLCGYLAGRGDLEFYLGNYRLAVLGVIQKYSLKLEARIESGQVPLQARPLLMTLDPLEATYVERAWLVLGLVLFCFCPCVGPAPLGAIFAFLCWSRQDKTYGRHVVGTDESDFEGAFVE